MADMNAEDIKSEIRKRGSTLAALAGAIGMHKQTFSLALTARVSAKAEEVIAAFIERSPSEIWPSRYGKDGKRINLRRTKAEMAEAAARAAVRKVAA